MKALKFIARIIFVLSVPTLLISASIGWGFNSLWLYKYGFNKYNVSQTTGLSSSELEKVARELISYFNSEEEYGDITVTKDGQSIPLFTEEESIHFKDVKELVWLDYKVFFISFAFCLVFTLICLMWRRKRYYRYLEWNVISGSGLTLLLMVALVIGSLLNFEGLFLQFHLLAFTNLFWSAPGYMLLLFPGGFWFDAAVFCMSAAAGLAAILGIFATVLILIKKRA